MRQLTVTEVEEELHDANIPVADIRLEGSVLTLRGTVVRLVSGTGVRRLGKYPFELSIPEVSKWAVEDPDEIGQISVGDVSREEATGRLVIVSNYSGRIWVESEATRYALALGDSPVAVRRWFGWRDPKGAGAPVPL